MGNKGFSPSSTDKPTTHFKCRYDPEDSRTQKIFTRTTDIQRFPVPLDQIKWNTTYRDYNPTNYTSPKIKAGERDYIDPDITEKKYDKISFNKYDRIFECDRTTYHGGYNLIPFSKEDDSLVPQNPVGRTGIIGRGCLGHWGPNHAADSIVTRWKRDKSKQKVVDKISGRPILQFIAIQRRDTKELAIPGGMREIGDTTPRTLIREMAQKALNKTLKFDEENKFIAKDEYEMKLAKLFGDGKIVYKGYVDDPRNTDNAWMETLACNFHDETSEVVDRFDLQDLDDNRRVQWLDISSSLDLFASHKDFIQRVAEIHKAHW